MQFPKARALPETSIARSNHPPSLMNTSKSELAALTFITWLAPHPSSDDGEPAICPATKSHWAVAYKPREPQATPLQGSSSNPRAFGRIAFIFVTLSRSAIICAGQITALAPTMRLEPGAWRGVARNAQYLTRLPTISGKPPVTTRNASPRKARNSTRHRVMVMTCRIDLPSANRSNASFSSCNGTISLRSLSTGSLPC
jgi:hypothetical protein